jgi:hypothetical protein
MKLKWRYDIFRLGSTRGSTVGYSRSSHGDMSCGNTFLLCMSECGNILIDMWPKAARHADMHVSLGRCIDIAGEREKKHLGGDQAEVNRVLSWLRRTAIATNFDAQTMAHYGRLQSIWKVLRVVFACSDIFNNFIM